MILAIDPGNVLSAYCLFEPKTEALGEFGKIDNHELLAKLPGFSKITDKCIIEKIMSYGMPVGETVFTTVYYTGIFACLYGLERVLRMPRKEVVLHLTHSMKGKDANVSRALKDRYGVCGTKKKPGKLYGVSKDVWAALGIAVCYSDRLMNRVWYDKSISL